MVTFKKCHTLLNDKLLLFSSIYFDYHVHVLVNKDDQNINVWTDIFFPFQSLFLSIREAAWYIIFRSHLSHVCLLDDKFRKLWLGKFIFAHPASLAKANKCQ